MVFSKVLSKKLALKINNKVALKDESAIVPADVLNDESFTGLFQIKDLFCLDGMIFVVPSSLYEPAENFDDIIFNEAISHSVEDAFLKMDRHVCSYR